MTDDPNAAADNDAAPLHGDELIRRRLGDLLEFAAEATYITSFGRPAYLAETSQGKLLRNGGERILIKVATVVEKLPRPFLELHPDIDWQNIMRMRNLVAHHYDRVNDDLMWAALDTEVPKLVRMLGLSA